MNVVEPTFVLVKNASGVGGLVRARRRAAGLTQAQAAGLAGVGTRFLAELERGKKTLRFDHVLQVLERLGFEIAVAPRAARAFARNVAATRTIAPSVPDSRPATSPSTPPARANSVKRKRARRE